MKKPYNPFLIKGYIDKYHFCNRDKEVKRLIVNIQNSTNTTLFSLRKIGKTGLIQHVFASLKAQKETQCIYVDLYATQTMHDLTQQLAKAIYASFPPKKGIAKQFIDTFKSWRPVISFDPLTGAPDLTLDLSSHQTTGQNVTQLLEYLESLQIPIVIAFDEFQQIVHYPEKNIEAILRTTIQHLHHCSFIFSGSHATLMYQIFYSAKRPFYNSTSNMYLDLIPSSEYQAFIATLFADQGRSISPPAIDFILQWTFGFTFHTQYLCHYIFAQGKKNIDEPYVRQMCASVLEEQENTYYQYRNLLTTAQWLLLKAIAKEEVIAQPYSQDFIQTHQLGNAANVKRSLESLLDKELIYEVIENGQKSYSVYDKFFLRWLQRR